MIELSKEDKKAAREILRRGILHRHAQWQEEMRDLLDKPYNKGENEYDRNMQITGKSREFYKEAMEMEDYYRGSQMIFGLAQLYHGQYLTDEDLEPLSEEAIASVRFLGQH